MNGDAVDSPTEICVANEKDRREIARLRHEVYAREIGQHPINDLGELSDELDKLNVMLVVRRRGQLAGFISLTPPTAPKYSVDKYFRRDKLPFQFHDGLFEARILTVVQAFRGQETTALLLYAALRWVEAHRGTHIVAIGRLDVLELYLRIGLQRQNLSIQSGAVTYELLHGEVTQLRRELAKFSKLVARLKSQVNWNLPMDFDVPAPCFHGGAFFEAIGERFDSLSMSNMVINADVLDAWYPPAPSVISAVEKSLPWLMRTSPPVHCTGLIATIAETRGVHSDNILPGAGSSELIFRVLRHWLKSTSRALILDPMYGEYEHILESIIGCSVERLSLQAADNFRVPVEELIRLAQSQFNLIVLVNPNSPTGQHIDRQRLECVLQQIPATTRVWIDETYVDYLGHDQSLEQFAARSNNVVVCKSMSKIFALSGMRVAYLCGGVHLLDSLRPLTPPWIVGLLSQVAAVEALKNAEYYEARMNETHSLRQVLAAGLSELGFRPIPGVANFLLCRVPDACPDADWMISKCKTHDLFLRNPAPTGSEQGSRWIRIAVKDQATNDRMLSIIRLVLAESNGSQYIGALPL